MKSNWPVKKLGEVTDLIMGQSPPSSTYNSIKDGLPFYQGKVDFGELFPTPRIWCSKPVKITEPNDILICVRAPVGPTNLSKERSCIGRGLAALRSKPKELDFMYLLLYLRSIENDLSKRGSGTTFSAIGKKELENLEIPVPPIEEQKRIVKKLEKILKKVEEASTLRQETITDIKMALKSVLNKIFSNKKLETKKIGEIVDAETKRYSDGGLSYLGMEDIESDTGELLGEPKTESVKSTTFYFNNAHVLYGKLRPYLNKVFLPTFEGHCTTEFIPLKPDPRILKREFLALWLRSPETLSQLSGRTTGTRMPRADMHLLMSLEIPLLDLKEQEEIVAYLDGLSEKVQALQKLQQEQVQDLEALKQSVLHKAFQGEL